MQSFTTHKMVSKQANEGHSLCTGDKNSDPEVTTLSSLHELSKISILPSSKLSFQPKLRINLFDDKDEREAEQVVHMPIPGIMRKCNKYEKEVTQNRIGADHSKSTASNTLTKQIQSSRGHGQPLRPDILFFMSNHFERNFSPVRIHTDRQAIQMNQEINARAFTVGSDIYFNREEYRPGTVEGKKLLAHELTHVVQQTGLNNAPVLLQPQIQRACGEDIPEVSSQCQGESGPLPEPIFRFRINCDDFLNNSEHERFNDLLDQVVPGDVFKVIGSSSEEGAFEFNERLSCARARLAAQALERRGAIITQRIAQGGQPGNRRDRRSVAVEKVATPGSNSSSPSGISQTVNISIFSFLGNSRNPFDDLTFANRVYADCGIQFQSVGGRTITENLLGDGTLHHNNDCGTFAPEESSLATFAENDVGAAAKIWIFYVPNFEPQPDAKGLSCTLSDLGGEPATFPPMIYIASDADPATLAHELGHLLIDFIEHHGIDNPANQGNVMFAPRRLSGGINIQLDASQCARIQSNLSRL